MISEYRHLRQLVDQSREQALGSVKSSEFVVLYVIGKLVLAQGDGPEPITNAQLVGQTKLSERTIQSAIHVLAKRQLIGITHTHEGNLFNFDAIDLEGFEYFWGVSDHPIHGLRGAQNLRRVQNPRGGANYSGNTPLRGVSTSLSTSFLREEHHGGFTETDLKGVQTEFSRRENLPEEFAETSTGELAALEDRDDHTQDLDNLRVPSKPPRGLARSSIAGPRGPLSPDCRHLVKHFEALLTAQSNRRINPKRRGKFFFSAHHLLNHQHRDLAEVLGVVDYCFGPWRGSLPVRDVDAFSRYGREDDQITRLRQIERNYDRIVERMKQDGL